MIHFDAPLDPAAEAIMNAHAAGTRLMCAKLMKHEAIDARTEAFLEERDREGLKTLIGQHGEMLGKLRLQLEGKEHAFVELEIEATKQALEGLLAKM